MPSRQHQSTIHRLAIQGLGYTAPCTFSHQVAGEFKQRFAQDTSIKFYFITILETKT